MKAEALHNKAMEYADEALLAKRRKQDDVAQSFFEKAFLLEKEAAFSVETTDDNSHLYKSILTRSAITLALDAGYVWEAQQLMKIAVQENIDKNLLQDFKDLEVVLEKRIKKSKGIPSITITGIITAFDTNINEIKVQPSTSEPWYKVLVPQDKIKDIIPAFWAQQVVIEGKSDQQGIIFLETIKRAA